MSNKISVGTNSCKRGWRTSLVRFLQHTIALSITKQGPGDPSSITGMAWLCSSIAESKQHHTHWHSLNYWLSWPRIIGRGLQTRSSEYHLGHPHQKQTAGGAKEIGFVVLTCLACGWLRYNPWDLLFPWASLKATLEVHHPLQHCQGGPIIPRPE